MKTELIHRWRANEDELARLRDLPVGVADPAAREAELDAEQDAIEGQIGREWMERRKGAELRMPDEA